MRLSDFEKMSLAYAPLWFAILLIVSGMVVSFFNPGPLHGIIMVCSGLICMSMYCICALLVKLVEK